MLKKGYSLGTRYFMWIVLGTLIASSVAKADDEFQYRLNTAFALKIAKNWKGTLSTESSHDDSGHQIKNYNDIGIAYTGITDWFDLGGNFRTIFQKWQGGTWVRENRLYLNLIARHRLFNIGLNHRIRLEYNSWDQRLNDFGTVRYRIGINPPFELDPIREHRILKGYNKIRPYGSYELSYNTFDHFISVQSFKAGLSMNFTERIIGNIYYTREERCSEIYDRDLNILGLDIKLLF